MYNETVIENLADISDVCVNTDLPKEERIMEFVRQVKNPFRFKCGGFTVTARFANGGPSLEDCLQRLLS